MNAPAHSVLSPSARYRWGVCPASVAACAKYEDRRSSPAAVDGTHTHTLLEHCIEQKVSSASTVGMVMTDHDGSFCVETDRAARVQLALDYLVTRPGEVFSEVKVNPSPLIGRTDCAGTVDIHIINGEELEVIDYKDGTQAVEVENNPQLELYMFGILARHILVDGTFPFKSVKMTIIQPKLAEFGKQSITSWDFPMEEFEERRMKLINEAAATDDANAPFVPGEKQCNFCPHSGNCSAKISHVLGNAGISFGAVDLAQQSGEKDVSSISDEQLRELVESAPMVRKMLELAEEEALTRIQSGKPVSGLKVVRGSGRRQWAMSEEEIATKLRRMQVPKDAIWRTSLISPAQLDKLKWENRAGEAKQLTEKQMNVVRNELVSVSEGKLTVVPEADKRQAIEYKNVAEMFGAIDALPDWLV